MPSRPAARRLAPLACAALALFGLARLTAPAHAIDGGAVAGRNALSRATVGVGSLTGAGEEAGVSRCSGVLIAPDLVLTAGHCVAGHPLGIGVTLYDGARPVGRPIPVRRVSRYAGNPSDLPARYATLRSLALDTALLRLASPVRDRAPVRLGRGTAPAGLRLAGAGLSAEGIGTLKTTRLDPVLRTPAGLIVAQTRGSEVCRGDSGGPVVADGPGGPTLWGVASAVLTDNSTCGRVLLVAPALPRL